MLQQVAKADAQNRTGVINFLEVPVHPRPGHATVHHHWGIRPLSLEIAPRKTLYEEFHPYGTSAYRAFQSSEVSAKRYRYTGKEKDEETKLYYHGARYLAPWLGRWMSPDPKGLVDGPGLYNYVRGSPVVLSDPSGGESHRPTLTIEPYAISETPAPTQAPTTEVTLTIEPFDIGKATRKSESTAEAPSPAGEPPTAHQELTEEWVQALRQHHVEVGEQWQELVRQGQAKRIGAAETMAEVHGFGHKLPSPSEVASAPGKITRAILNPGAAGVMAEVHGFGHQIPPEAVEVAAAALLTRRIGLSARQPTAGAAEVGGSRAPTRHAWTEVRARLGRELDLPAGTPVHHWAIPQGGKGRVTLGGFLKEQWGRYVPDWIKNRRWNLMLPPRGYRDPLLGGAWHLGLHGQGRWALGLGGRLWHGSPTWAKGAALGVPVGAGVGTYYLERDR